MQPMGEAAFDLTSLAPKRALKTQLIMVIMYNTSGT